MLHIYLILLYILVAPLDLHPFQFLVDHGLQRDHRMLDVGCGMLRGGLHFIEYLDPEGYVGIDISQGVIDVARQSVPERGLEARKPRLLVTGDLKFGEFADEAFDVLLAQSVFTHLPAQYIEECMAHVGRVLRPAGVFWFTFKLAAGLRTVDYKQFEYPFSFFESAAGQHGLQVELLPEDAYPHPRGQRMVKLTAAPA